MNRDAERPLTDEEVAEALKQSAWEQGAREQKSEVRIRKAEKVACEWCGMFAALPGMPRCGICDESKGGRR